jgi:PAS domain S-box-containing protein
MGAIMRRHDWSRTSVGEPRDWPQSLRTAVRLLLNTGHPMYIFWGEEGACFYNDAYRQSIGAERHPLSLGRPAREVWDEIWDIIGPQIAQVMAGHGATWHENQLVPITRNGVRDDVYWTYSFGPLDDAAAPSGVGGVLVVCTETTQQVEMARQLAESEERLQVALSGGRGVGTWDWDVVNDRVVADLRFAALYGVDPEKARAGAPVAEFFQAMHPDDLPAVRAQIAETLRTGKPFSAEYRLLRQSGEECWVVAEGKCQFAADGTPLRFPGVSFDISDRKNAERRLRDLNTELERKVNERSLERGRTWALSPDLLGVLNGAGFFENTNPAWQAVLGWTAEEIGKTPFFDFLHPDDVGRNHIAFDAAIRGQPAIRFENRYRRRDGGYRWLSWVAIPEGGKIYCSARDVTEEKEQAAALQAAQEALRQSQKMEAVGQLTGGLAHDFNNLLAGISGSLDIMQKRIQQGRVDALDRYILAAQTAVKRAAALTHRLLAFSRRQTLDPKATNVNQLILEMEDLVRRTMGPAVTVEVVGAGGLWSTLVDPNQLENALLNLCLNARDAMPDGGRLTIETANKWLDDRAGRERDLPPGQYISLCVSDTGTGMPPEVIEKAFDPFFTTKPLGQGTGLGLSMIYGFARQSGGQVRIYSEVNSGTTMCIYLPRHDHDDADEEADAAEEALALAGDGEVVLVVEDEPVIRMLIAEVLEEAGYTALEAADGPAAMKVVRSPARIDLLITDVGLPGGLNGRQVADAARVLRPGLKTLFITGYAENAAVGNGHLDRGMAIVTKPFAVDVLAQKVREMMEG